MNSGTTTRDVTRQIAIPQKLINKNDLSNTLNLSKDIEIIKTSPGIMENSIINGIQDIDSIFKIKNEKAKNEKQKLNFNNNKYTYCDSQTNIYVNKDSSLNISDSIDKNKNKIKIKIKKLFIYFIIIIICLFLFVSVAFLTYNIVSKYTKKI